MMTAFVPITPDAAIEITDGVATPLMLADFAQAGLVKGYARLIETVMPTGRIEVRDKRIGRDLWRRIIADGKVAEIWSAGTVRLAGDELRGGVPAVSIIGIRFDATSLRTLVEQHDGNTECSKPVTPRPTVKRLKLPLVETSVDSVCVEAVEAIVVTAPSLHVAPSSARGMAPDAIALSIDETRAALGLGRTTVHKLINEGKLVATKVGGRTLIQANSIRVLLTPVG